MAVTSAEPGKSRKNAYSVRESYQDAVANGAKDICVFDSRGEMQ